MVWIIARKEILENLNTYRFAILSGLLALLMGVSLLVSYGDYRLAQENYDVLRPPPNSPNLIIEPTPNAIVAKGLEANLGRLYELTGRGIEVRQNQQSVNRLFSLFAVPDLLFIIKVMLSLIAILFAYDAVSAEKERGTLKLTLASGGERASVILGKFAGRFVLVFVPFLGMFLVYCLVLSLLPNVQLSGPHWGRLAFAAAAAGLYAFIFIGVGIAVSSTVHRSVTALVFSLSVWILFVFIVPNLGTTIATAVSPLPPAERVEMQGRLASIRAIYESIQRQKSPQAGNEQLRMIREIRAANSEMLDSYRPKLNGLLSTTRTLVRLSPAGALTFLETDIANTGLLEEVRLKDAVTGYYARNFERINGWTKEPVESFHYDRASLNEVLSQSGLVDLGILILFGGIFLGVAFFGFYAYDPR
jgi:ABC-type transport system involved in multi-copper enzyme maturation permease subunit